jgi:uncharacterized membrane protein YgcG
MNRNTGLALALSALTLISAANISAQSETESERGRRGMRRSANAETVMSMREHLELTEYQIAQLDAIRADDVTRQNATRAELGEMSSKLQAGQIRRSEMMAFMENRRDAAMATAGDLEARIQGVLTETQLGSLEETRARRQAGARGRASARGGRSGGHGARGGRGARGARGARSGREGDFGSARGQRRAPTLGWSRDARTQNAPDQGEITESR